MKTLLAFLVCGAVIMMGCSSHQDPSEHHLVVVKHKSTKSHKAHRASDEEVAKMGS